MDSRVNCSKGKTLISVPNVRITYKKLNTKNQKEKPSERFGIKMSKKILEKKSQLGYDTDSA